MSVLGMLAIGGAQAQNESASMAILKKASSTMDGALPGSVLRADGTYWELDQAAESYAGGTGTEADPYQIATPEQFIKFCRETYKTTGRDTIYYEGVYFKQTADLDFSAAYANVLRVGVGGFFSGTYDGGNFAIKGLKQVVSNDNEVDSTHIGIAPFANIVNATIKNVVLEDVEVDMEYPNMIHSSIRGGMLVYAPQNSVIENCSVSGNISLTVGGEDLSIFIGGIAGIVVDTEINNCRTEGTANVKYNVKGGTAESENFSSVGGIVAEAVDATKIMNSVSTLSINNEAEDASEGFLFVRSGGMATWAGDENTQIVNCAHIAPLSAVSKTADFVQVGGIISCCTNVFLDNVWTASTLNSEGGVEGENIGSIVASFDRIGSTFCAYDVELSGIFEEEEEMVGSAFDTEFMQSQDFVDLLNSHLPEGGFAWGYVEGSYPVLTSSTDVPEPEDPTANESVTASETVLRVLPGAVVVTSPEAVPFAAYTFSGAMQANELLPAGTSTVNLPAGLYILKVGEETYKVNVK